MKKRITSKCISALKPQISSYKVWDTEISGFFLRVMPSGTKTYCVHYRHEGLARDYTLGRHGAITPTIARELAKSALGDVARGKDVQAEKKLKREKNRSAKFETLGGFIEHKYTDWVLTERKTGQDTLDILKRDFSHLYKKKMPNITAWELTKWRTEKLKGTNSKPLQKASVNRRLMALKAVLSKAVVWNVIEQNPLIHVKPLKLDGDKRVRFLSEQEETRLYAALKKRQKDLVEERQSANKWREVRGYELLPDLLDGSFIDHIEPITILAMNTGMRRGEIFQLTWENVNLKGSFLTVAAASAKSGKTRHISLNEDALETLTAWKNQSVVKELVFPSPVTGRSLNNIKKAWKSLLELAQIDDFRFHDLRHHFASKLVMGGVDLNSARELLGHASIEMTLRYAHLAPEHKAAAVAVLNKQPQSHA